MKYAAIAVLVCVALLCVPTQADACGPACAGVSAFASVGPSFVTVQTSGPRFTNAAFVSGPRVNAFVGGGFGGGATIINQQVNTRRGVFGRIRDQSVSQQIINTR